MKYLIGITILLSCACAFSYSYSCNGDGDLMEDPTENTATSRIDTFTFSSNGSKINGKIFLPASFEKDKNLPAIFLIDYTEQHFKIAKDEFEKVIEGVQAIEGQDALVITLEEHRDVESNPQGFAGYYEDYKNMASYVNAEYTGNTSRTFIGRGSEGGIVLMTMFLEESESAYFHNFIVTDPASYFSTAVIKLIEIDDFPKNKANKKLHFSFSSSNNVTVCRNLVEAIKGAQYPWLEFESVEYLGNDYENTYPVSFAAGLRFVFEE